MLVSKFFVVRDYEHTLLFLLLIPLALAIPHAQFSSLLVVWLAVFAAYGTGSPYKGAYRGVIAFSAIAGSWLFITGSNELLARSALSASLFTYCRAWDEVVTSDWISYLCVTVALIYIWLV